MAINNHHRDRMSVLLSQSTSQPHIERLLADCPVFLDTDINYIAKRFKLAVVERGTIVGVMGKEFDRALVVDTGLLKLVVPSVDGHERIIHIGTRGHAMSIPFILSEHLSPFSVEAITDLLVAVASPEAMRSIAIENPRLYINALNYSCNFNAIIVQGPLCQTYSPLLVKIIRALLGCLPDEDMEKEVTVLELTHECIAQYSGTTRESVTRQLHVLADRGAVLLSGYRRITVYPRILQEILGEVAPS
jgi:CRP-like cAMP-binding protein